MSIEVKHAQEVEMGKDHNDADDPRLKKPPKDYTDGDVHNKVEYHKEPVLLNLEWFLWYAGDFELDVGFEEFLCTSDK